jgi:hypothetical protein
MTAIVGVLNKRAAVMAADSAVTVSNDKGVKVYNTATKIFKLSDEHPIGVMIYDNVEFMGTPWDLIFNLYRQERGNRACCSVQEYAEAFIRFLKDHDYFSSDESRENYLLQEISSFYNMVKGEVLEQLEKEEIGLEDENVVRDKLKEVMESIAEVYKEAEVCAEMDRYTEREFRKTSKEFFDSLMDACAEENLPVDMREEWEQGLFLHIRSNIFLNNTATGIVFVGYGDKDIFPSAFPIVISGAVDNRLRYFFNQEKADRITHDNTAWILPFAQEDVMLTMMKGIAPDLFSAITDEMQESLGEVVRQVTQTLGIPEEQTVKVAAPIIEETQKRFVEKVHEIINEKYVSGLVDTVEFFNVEDMANLAESLISITNLQRHITSSEETVGGPIDVVVITKTGGFQWIKQK